MTSRLLFIPGSAGEHFGRVLRTRRAGGFVFRESRYRGSLRMPSHYHPRAYFSFVVAGRIREREGRVEHDYAAGSLHFHPAGDPHAGLVAPGGATFLSIVLAGESGERLPARPCPGPGRARAARLARRCLREMEATDSAAEIALEALGLELMATALPPAAPAERRAPRWLAAVRDHLHAHALDRVRLADLSALAGIHPVHLVRAFRHHVGSTPGSYLRRLRVEHARLGLIESDLPIAELALAAGFSSQAHFTRVFRRLVGTTPAAYRGGRPARRR